MTTNLTTARRTATIDLADRTVYMFRSFQAGIDEMTNEFDLDADLDATNVQTLTIWLQERLGYIVTSRTVGVSYDGHIFVTFELEA